jgi:DNA-directed RNA polymerase I, II, and III subunit RPABC1
LSRPYESETSKVYVYFADQKKTTKQLGVDIVADAISTADKYGTKNLILITPVPLTSSARKKVEELVSYTVSIFLESEMVYDPTEHYFTPEHRALSSSEQRDFLKRNNLSIDQFPIILTTDMISRYYGFRPGQVIEIKRVNMFDSLVQNPLSYRVVKEDV